MPEFKAMGIKADRIDGDPEAVDNFNNMLGGGLVTAIALLTRFLP